MKVANLWLVISTCDYGNPKREFYLLCMLIYLFVYDLIILYIVQRMKQVLINLMQDHHYVWFYDKSSIIKGWWDFYLIMLNFLKFQYLYLYIYIYIYIYNL